MPFITQGKTNWKFLLIVIILTIIVDGAALWYTIKLKSAYPLTDIGPGNSNTHVTSSLINIHKIRLKYKHRFLI